MALLAGTDLECGAGSWAPGAPDSFQTLGDAVKQGLVKEGDLDTALRRLFRAQMRLGVYDPRQRLPWAGYTYEGIVDSPKHRQLALEAARKSIVLLKNENATLPLRKDLGHVAVIGPNADEVEVLLGNYNGTPIAPVTVLAGIRAAAGAGTKVTFARGGPLAAGLPDLHVVPGSALARRVTAGPASSARTTAATSTARPSSSGSTPRSTSTGPTRRPPRRSTTTPSAFAGPGRSPRRRRVATPSACAARRSAASSSRACRSPRAARTTSP